jgi:hypothetical protein
MTPPKKPERIYTDEELGVVSSGQLPVATELGEEWSDESRQQAMPMPMPKVILKHATVQPILDGNAGATEG